MIRKGSARLSPRALKQVHGNLVVKGIASRLQPLRDLLLACVATFHGSMDYARKVFDGIPHPDLFMHNVMVRGYAHGGAPAEAFALYRLIEAARLRPDAFTFCYLLRACAGLSSGSRSGYQVHGAVVKLGLLKDAFVRNALINMHAKCGDLQVAGTLLAEAGEGDVVAWSAIIAGHAARGDLDIARKFFDDCRHKDLVCWNVMVAAYAKHGEMEKARELIDCAPQKDVVSWNTIITGYAAKGILKEALEVLDEMKCAGWMPDEATIVSLLSCCANLGSLETGRIVQFLHLEGRPISIILGNALVSMYAKCGDVQAAMEVFSRMKERDVWTWNSVIGGLAFHGQAKQSIQFFEKMLEAGICPNAVSFLCVLGACSHAGFVEEGQRYFSVMKYRYMIEPNARHYSCIVDMLGRAGLLDEAFAILSSMRCEPSAVIWRTLLGACRIHGNAALGKLARERLLKMNEDASGDYVMLSGIYASSGEWFGVETVRGSMDERGLIKVAGYAQVDEKMAYLSAL